MVFLFGCTSGEFWIKEALSRLIQIAGIKKMGTTVEEKRKGTG